MLKIVSDSACDFSKIYADKLNVEIVPLYVTFDGNTYSKDLIEIDRDTFYQKMVDEGSFPKTSLPSVQDYLSIFEQAAQNNDELICLCITSSLSGSYNSASTALNILKEDYPDARVMVHNSHQNTVGQALLVEQCATMRDAGKSYDEINNAIRQIKEDSQILFTTSTLEYLKKGGRIGKILFTATGKLNIQPILHLSKGELGLSGVSRSRKKALKSVISKTAKFFESHDKSDYLFTVGYGYDLEEGINFRSRVEEELGITCIESEEGSLFDSAIGAVTACHTGPYAIGIAFARKYDRLKN